VVAVDGVEGWVQGKAGGARMTSGGWAKWEQRQQMGGLEGEWLAANAYCDWKYAVLHFSPVF
jgi:hypothetical protein